MDRRDFLKTVAVTGLAGAAAGQLGLTGTAAQAALAPAYDRSIPTGWTYPAEVALLPFGHGVVSGDPLADRVVLWTRITIPDARGWDALQVPDPQGIRSVQVRWVIARDPGLTRVVRRGTVTTTAARDWTVKVDADRLPAATTMYYAFEALGFRSPIGRTRTAPAATTRMTELTVAHVACTSWWQDVFNAFGRIGDRDDLDLVTHAGDHVYDNSGGHPASRFHAGQTKWDTDLDNKDWQTVAECRRRYALYYADANLLRAHLAAPFAIMPDQHDDDPAKTGDKVTISQVQASQVFYEWTATRPTIPDGTGRFRPSPGPDVNVAVPQGTDALYHYRVLPYGALAEVVLFDIRRFANREGEESQVLGDVQTAWLQGVLKDTKRRGVTHRLLVQQVNLSQLRAFNTPLAAQLEQAFGLQPNAPQGEFYTVGWGAHPAERARLFRFLRTEGIIDNVVVSGDSHGFFGSDLVEDPEPPSYEPLTGGGLLGAVGVEMVGSTMGRPGAQDVLAETLYFTENRGSRGAAYTDAVTFDTVYRPQGLAGAVALEQGFTSANPNLRYINWKAEYGYAMVHLRADRAVIEALTTPQRVVGPAQRLLAQFSSPVGAPHLGAVLNPTAVRGSRQDAPAPTPTTVGKRE